MVCLVLAINHSVLLQDGDNTANQQMHRAANNSNLHVLPPTDCEPRDTVSEPRDTVSEPVCCFFLAPPLHTGLAFLSATHLVKERRTCGSTERAGRLFVLDE